MRKQAYLGLDIGGSGAKAGVFDKSGRMLGFGHISIDPTLSSQGFVEVDINKVHEAAKDAVREAVLRSNADIRALAVSSQGQTFVTLDEQDRPLHPAIIWHDSRAAEQCRELQEALRNSDRNEKSPYAEAISTGPKIMWLQDRFPDMMASARRYLLLPEYISYMLTGRGVTDPSTAASTGLYAEGSASYNPTALSTARISESQLAEVMPSGSVVGCVHEDIAEEWGLSSWTQVVTGANDQLAGALGAGNSHPGIVSETTGTCLALITVIERSPRGVPAGLMSGPFTVEGFNYVLAYAKTAGVVLDWYRREISPGMSFKQLDELAKSSPIGSNGVTVLPHFDGMVSPVPNPHARGCFCNLTLSTSASDIYRAILESLSFSLKENIQLLNDSGFPVDVVRSIGGAAKSDFWLQMKADVLNLPVERPRVYEAATLGAAAIAAAGAGAFPTIQEASEAMYHADRVFRPNSTLFREYDEAFQRYQSLWMSIYKNTLS